MKRIRTALLGRVTERGLGYIVDDSTGNTFAFTFDKFPNYKGESARELGLTQGSKVTFELDDSGMVKKVSPPEKRFRWLDFSL